MKPSKLIAIAAVAVLLGSNAGASEAPVFFEFVRPLGMGGAFTAVADDQNVFSYNPAGMVQRTGAEVTILEVAGGINTDFEDGANFVKDNEEKLNNYDGTDAAFTNEIVNTMVPLRPRARVAADLASFVSGPKFMGLPIHGGIGAFGGVDFGFKFNFGSPAPTVSFNVNNDILIPISIAKRFDAPVVPGKIGVGLTGKFISRKAIREDRVSLLAIDDIKAPPISDGKGIGSDLGFLYQPGDRLNVGVMVRDFLGTKISYDKVDPEDGWEGSPERDTVIRPRTDLGFAYTPETFFGIGHTSDRFVFAADLRDVLTNDEHVFFQEGFHRPLGQDFWERVHLGAEYRWWFLRLRGGAYQGYPTFGVGIDIPFFKLDYAYHGRELGERAGDLREDNHIVSLAFRFGTGNTEARERISKSKESRRNRGSAVPDTVPDKE
jgi:hypothetical protein